ncbi:hypothetical protein TrRE_jg12067, partial [Triparma retinervis]
RSSNAFSNFNSNSGGGGGGGVQFGRGAMEDSSFSSLSVASSLGPGSATCAPRSSTGSLASGPGNFGNVGRGGNYQMQNQQTQGGQMGAATMQPVGFKISNMSIGGIRGGTGGSSQQQVQQKKGEKKDDPFGEFVQW